MSCDVLAIGPHPDDVELGAGGIVAHCAAQGKAVAILDLTRGELASRGTPEERAEEAAEAGRILGAAKRVNAGLPDGGLANNAGQRMAIIKQIREFRPQVVLAPFHTDHHPDHDAAHHLIRDAAHLAGLAKIDTGQERFRPSTMLYYRVYGDSTMPALVMDVTDGWNTKQRALAAHQSQLYNPSYEGAETRVSSKAFWESIETRARYWGDAIGVTYGEPIYALGPVSVDTLPGLE